MTTPMNSTEADDYVLGTHDAELLRPEAGAKTIQEIKNVGGGRLIASVKDEDGNIIGLIQDPG